MDTSKINEMHNYRILFDFNAKNKQNYSRRIEININFNLDDEEVLLPEISSQEVLSCQISKSFL